MQYQSRCVDSLADLDIPTATLNRKAGDFYPAVLRPFVGRFQLIVDSN
jgi:hypothetical protein